MPSFIGADYNETPYPDFAFPLTHPAHLAALGVLHGIPVAPVEACRVLEVGCAGGGNVIPMAYALPKSHFVGIDLSAQQIAGGQRAIRELGLRNIELIACDLRDVGAELGQFDYIIAHGVYSWVPAPVRDGLLALCRRLLAPHGLAYISYNTYPGWQPLQALRESFITLTGRSRSTTERVGAVRTMLADIAATTQPGHEPYASVVRSYSRFELDLLSQLGAAGDAYLSHDLLETENSPCWFVDFAAHAQSHGLQFLTEAEYAATCADSLDPALQALLEPFSDAVVPREHLIDTIRNRMFRMSLLCHVEESPQRSLCPDVLQPLYIAADLHILEPMQAPAGPEVQRFGGPEGLRFSTSHPLSKAVLHELAQHWPQSMTFSALVERAAARFELPSAPSARDTATVRRMLLKLLRMRPCPIQLTTTPSLWSPTVGVYPRASLVARLQARSSTLVTNLRHHQIHLDPISLRILPLLDGRHSQRDLAAAHARIVAESASPGETTAVSLNRIAQHALLHHED